MGGRPSEAGIWSSRSGWKYTTSYSNSPDAHWTPMVWAPGSECVFFWAKMVKFGGQLTDTGQKKLC